MSTTAGLSAASAFELLDVSRTRGGTHVLSGINLCIPAASMTCLVGPSGAGKTSLLRLLNRLDEPSSGIIRLCGVPVTDLPVSTLRRRVAFVFQTPVMFEGTVCDNLEIACRLAAQPVEMPRLEQLLGSVELPASALYRSAATLSGGEKQRVALARALVATPEVLLLDEPTAALDTELAARLMALLARLREQSGVTMVMVTHRRAEARDAASYLVLLEAGRVVEQGPSATLIGGGAEGATARFLNIESNARA